MKSYKSPFRICPPRYVLQTPAANHTLTFINKSNENVYVKILSDDGLRCEDGNKDWYGTVDANSQRTFVGGRKGAAGGTACQIHGFTINHNKTINIEKDLYCIQHWEFIYPDNTLPTYTNFRTCP